MLKTDKACVCLYKHLSSPHQLLINSHRMPVVAMFSQHQLVLDFVSPCSIILPNAELSGKAEQSIGTTSYSTHKTLRLTLSDGLASAFRKIH